MRHLTEWERPWWHFWDSRSGFGGGITAGAIGTIGLAIIIWLIES